MRTRSMLNGQNRRQTTFFSHTDVEVAYDGINQTAIHSKRKIIIYFQHVFVY